MLTTILGYLVGTINGLFIGCLLLNKVEEFIK